MKTIKILNTFAVGLPLLLAIISLIVNELLIIAAYSTMITGAIQLLLGLFLFMKEPRNKYLILYLLVVIAFFSLWYYNVSISYCDYLGYILFPIPLLLAIYLSILIYKKEKLWISTCLVIPFT